MDTPYDSDNIFARILRGQLPCHKIHEDEATFAFMDIMPRGDGHCLVIPKAKARNLLDADDDALASLLPAVARIARAARAALGADGVTIQQFNEPAAGQEVYHLHVHVIPRFEGVPLRPHTGERADPDRLREQAAAIRAALGQES